ncbi:acyl-CoA dehydrogenase [Nocardia sp. CA-107356]|uniref:acyl-CoA dehydrogenase n=1 Tax=Nocardia sp. CA-107356 TaxID=3239972 RepID=UPI003D943116
MTVLEDRVPEVASHTAASALEAALGDPTASENPYGFAAMVRRAEQEAFPSALTEIAGPALRLAYIPADEGGDLVHYDQTLTLVRIAARRDLTIMPATMIDITATLCVLLAGDADQRERVVRLLRSGGSIGFAFSEPEHGSDLLANTCAMTPDRAAGGWRLNGEKWLVGFGRIAEAMLVIAHSGGRGPAAYSMVLVDNPLALGSAGRRAAEATGGTAKIRLQRPTGMRGTDFAHFEFDGVPVGDEAVVGRLGRGMETAMRAMQVVRATSTGANLAAMDSALRLTMDFAHEHNAAGRPVAQHPHNRRELGTAAAALIACDVVATACARSIHTFPAAQSLWSGLVKTVLTDLSAEVFDRCADVLGTRSVLREGPEAAFDVLRADNAVVRYFDTSPMANLRLVSVQLGRFTEDGFSAKQAGDRELLATTFDVDAALPPVDFADLALSARGLEVVTGALPREMRAIFAAARPCTAQTLALLDRLDLAMHAVRTRIRGLTELSSAERATTALDLATEVGYLHAAAACTQLWWFNRARSLYGTTPGSLDWLLPALALLLDRAEYRRTRLPMPLADSAFDVVARLRTQQCLFAAQPVPLAPEKGMDQS